MNSVAPQQSAMTSYFCLSGVQRIADNAAVFLGTGQIATVSGHRDIHHAWHHRSWSAASDRFPIHGACHSAHYKRSAAHRIYAATRSGRVKIGLGKSPLRRKDGAGLTFSVLCRFHNDSKLIARLLSGVADVQGYPGSSRLQRQLSRKAHWSGSFHARPASLR